MFQTFKQHSLYVRKEQVAKLKIKYPDRVPVILEKYHGTVSAPSIDKNKYLVPRDATIGNFMHTIRRRIQLSERQALFLFCASTIPPVYELMGSVYEQHKDDDGFLYMSYTTENTFGSK